MRDFDADFGKKMEGFMDAIAGQNSKIHISMQVTEEEMREIGALLTRLRGKDKENVK